MIENKDMYEQQNIFGDAELEEAVKKPKHAGKRVKKQQEEPDIEEALVLQENPVIIESVRVAGLVSQDSTKQYISAPVMRSVVYSDEMNKILMNSATFEAIAAESADEATTWKSTFTMSEELFAPIRKAGLTGYDRAVLEAIYSQLLASENTSNAAFTVRGIFRTMCGSHDKNLKPSQGQRERIMKTIMLLMTTLVKVEMNVITGSGKPATIKKYLPLVPCVMEDLNMGGNMTAAIRVTATPPFLSYAEGKKGLTATPLDMLNIPTMNATERNLAIKNFLQHKYAAVTYDANASEERAKLRRGNELYIDYEQVYDVAEVKPLSEMGKEIKKINPIYESRVRDAVHTILDEWKSKGYIEDWEDIREQADGTPSKRLIRGVTLKLPNNIPPVP